jgi:hypothetical protein
MIYLENNMDGDATAHLRASEAIDATLGDLVYRPTGTACASLPLDVSRSQIRAAGKRVILTGNCGPGVWTSWVFSRGDRWKESSSPEGSDYPDYPACIASERVPGDYDHSWIRWYEDSTWLSAMVAGQRDASELTTVEARRMVRCGVDMIGFDQLQPYDPRLAVVVWSWAPNEPASSADGICAFIGSDGRFRSGDCATARPYVCVDAAGEWTVAGSAGPGTDGATGCAAAGATFSLPKSGYEDELVKAALGGGEAWLNNRVVGGVWTPA